MYICYRFFAIKSDLDINPALLGDPRETFQAFSDRNSQLTVSYGFSYTQEGKLEFVNTNYYYICDIQSTCKLCEMF